MHAGGAHACCAAAGASHATQDSIDPPARPGEQHLPHFRKQNSPFILPKNSGFAPSSAALTPMPTLLPTL